MDYPALGDIVNLRHLGRETEWRVQLDLPQHLHLVSTVTGQRRAITKRAWRIAAAQGRAVIVSRSGNIPLGVPLGRPSAS